MARSLNWLKTFNRPTRPIRKAPKLGIESLEARDVPANFNVTNLSDNILTSGSLRYAVNQANTTGGDDTITINSSLAGQLDISAIGALNIDGNFGGVDIINNSANFSITGNSTSQIFTTTNNAWLTINNLLLTNGKSATNGGAVDNEGTGTLTLNNVTVAFSTAGASGGGVYSAGYLSIDNSTFDNDSAFDLGGALESALGLSVTGSTFTNNTAAYGGAILGYYGTTISESTFTKNSATIGAGGAIWVNGVGAALDVTSSSVSSNTAGTTVTAGSGGGGGIFMAAGALNITSSEVRNNEAGGNGGGIFSASGNVFVGGYSSIDENSSNNNGGGIAAYGTVTVQNSDVSSNTADADENNVGDGGGIWASSSVSVSGSYFGSSSSSSSNNTSVNNNSAENGGGIFSTGGTVTISYASVSYNGANNDGGGIDGQTVDVEYRSYIESNDAYGNTTGNGGGILANTVTVDSAYVYYNYASNAGGGIYGSTSVSVQDDASVYDNWTYGNGGGIYGGDVMVAGASVESNWNYGSGGGIYATGSVALTSNASVDYNSAECGSGGGIYAAGGQVTIGDSSSVYGNFANSNGGGVYGTTNVNITSASVNCNHVNNGYGGGVYVATGTVTVNNGSVSSNYGATQGGGIYVSTTNGVTSTAVKATSATIDGNSAHDSGGGLYVATGNVLVNNSTISRNIADDNQDGGGNGGGIYNADAAGDVSVTNSTVALNSAGTLGGGIYSANTATLNNDTIVQNTLASGAAANAGAGVYVGNGAAVANPITINSTIVVGNYANASGGDNSANQRELGAATGTATGTNNVIGSTASAAGLTNGVNANHVAYYSTGSVVNLSSGLGYHGGPTETYLLSFGSIAVANGSNILGLTSDQRGDAFGTSIDVGAVQDSATIASAIGVGANIELFDSNGDLIATLTPPVGGTGAVQFALGDVTGDGVADIVAAAGSGGGKIVVYDGSTGNIAKTLTPYGASYKSGINVAIGNVDGVGNNDIIVGPGTSTYKVEVLDYASSVNNSAGSVIASFTPFPNAVHNGKYTGGVRVAAGDVYGDGKAEVIVGTAAPQAAMVEVWGYTAGVNATGRFNTTRISQFAPAGITGSGVFVAVGGDVNNDGKDDIIVGSAKGKSVFAAFTAAGKRIGAVHQAFANKNSTQEVRVGVEYVDGSQQLIVAPGATGPQTAYVYDPTTLALEAPLNAFLDLTLPNGYNKGLVV